MQLHGLAPSGDAAFEAVDEVGREAFEPGEQGAQDHEDAFIEYLSGNIDDAGAEVRSLDQRVRRVGHFGDWMRRAGHTHTSVAPPSGYIASSYTGVKK